MNIPLLENVKKRGETYYFNSYNKVNVKMNEDSYKEFIKINEGNIMNNKLQETGFFPYQSIDMRNSKDARFAKKDDFDKYEKCKKDFENKMENILNEFHKNKMINIWNKYNKPIVMTNLIKNMTRYDLYEYLAPKSRNFKDEIDGGLSLKRNFNLISDIEIHKMKRINNKYNYKYLIQLDEDNITKHTKDILHVIDKLSKNDIHYTFIPYIPNNRIINDFTPDEHNTYNKINIVNNKKCVTYFKEKFPTTVSKLIYELNKIFYYYNDAFEILSKNTGFQITNKNFIDVILDIQHKKIWGMNKDSVVKRLNERNNLLRGYLNYVQDCDSEILYKNYFEFLSTQEIIMDNKEMLKKIQNCNVKNIKPEELITDNISFDTCKNIKFINVDKYKYFTYLDICKNILTEIKDQTIKQNLENHALNNKSINKCYNPSNDLINFKLFIEFTPEWSCAVYDNNFEEAYQHRQLLLGKFEITDFFQKCSLLFRSDPFTSKSCDLPGIEHDIEWNKCLISCVGNSDDIFPMRIVNGNEIETMNIYENFIMENDLLIGSVIVNLSGDRTNNINRYYMSHLYYDETRKDNPIKSVDYRNNILNSGSLIEHIRVLYLELNTLMFYKEDIGIKLYFYKLVYDNNFDIFVSKFPMEIIKEKYKIMNQKNNYNFLNEINLDKLEEVELTKNYDKIFKFIPINKHVMYGGNTSNIISIFSCFSNYIWDIKLTKNNIVFDKEVFSISLQNKQIKSIEQFKNYITYDISCTAIGYLIKIPYGGMGKYSKHSTILHKKDTKGKIYKSILKNIDQLQTVLSYNFEGTISIYINYLLNNYLNITDAKYVIFAKNHYILDGLLYYIKFKQLKTNFDIIFYAYEVENELYEKEQNYLDINKIIKIPIKIPMNNNWINDNKNKIKNIDISFIDIIISIPNLTDIRYAFLLQSQIPPIILTLQNLNKNGSIVLNLCIIPNKMVFDFMTYLSCYFEKTFIMDFKDTDLHSAGQLLYSFITFHKYKGNADIEKLLKLNEIMFDCDPTGGYNFNTDKQKKYVTNIITINDDMKNNYSEYKEYVKMKLLGSIRNFNDKYDNFINKDKQYIKDKCNIAKLQAIYYAKKYDLPLLDWVNEIPSTYFDRMIGEKLKNINYTTQDEIKSDNDEIIIDIHKKITCSNCDLLIKNIEISETAYQYIEKINYDAYKNVELFINNKYKRLNKSLFDDYDVNINGKSVSRAWIKFYELLTDTKILDKYKNDNKIDVFFMCEAPGNFVNSMDHYIKKNTNIKNFNWNAQSLAQSHADFFDSYGFIKKTIDKWDQGPTKNGNILDSDNQNYYFNKYGDKVDFLIGDCGEKWTPGETDNNKDTSIYQLFYALLMPKIGGTFVIKTFSSNNNKLFLSLLYLICSKYEKVLAFKSNTNFWSPEIYFVGVNYKGLTNEERQNIKKIISKTNDNETCYPFDKIPEEFIKTYADIMYNYISFASDVKKFFVFLSTNEDIYESNKENITNIILDKNNGWMKKYLGERVYKF